MNYLGVNSVESSCCQASMETGTDYGHDGLFGQCSDCGAWTIFEPTGEAIPISTEDVIDTNNLDEELKAFEASQWGSGININTKPVTAKDRLTTIWPEFKQSFDPETISWIDDDRIAITCKEGAEQAIKDGHFVINVAQEIYNNADVKVVIQTGSGYNNLHPLMQLADIIENVLTTSNKNVVVHCAMGMERSVLTVVWFMATKWGMSLQDALDTVTANRPIAQDRLDWIL
jgi:hypothetical protein